MSDDRTIPTPAPGDRPSFTILVDGNSTRACLCLAVQMDGREVTTVEGLRAASDLSLRRRSNGWQPPVPGESN